MFCSKCGKAVDNAGRFCPYCGNELGGNTDNVGNMRMNQKESAVPDTNIGNYGTGTVVWLVICMVMNILAGIVAFKLKTVFPGLVGIGIGVLYGLLWQKKDIRAFQAIVVLFVILTIYNLINHAGLYALSGLVNPLITWFVIKRYDFLFCNHQ